MVYRSVVVMRMAILRHKEYQGRKLTLPSNEHTLLPGEIVP